MSDSHVIEQEGGTITIPAAVLALVAVGAAEEVEAARARRPRRGVRVDVDGRRARVGIELAVRYGAVRPEVAEEVQRRVAERLRAMCDLDVPAVDVRVEELDG